MELVIYFYFKGCLSGGGALVVGLCACLDLLLFVGAVRFMVVSSEFRGKRRDVLVNGVCGPFHGSIFIYLFIFYVFLFVFTFVLCVVLRFVFVNDE